MTTIAIEKKCERCQRRSALKTERYCVHCREVMLKKMAREGYLQQLPEELNEEREYRGLMRASIIRNTCY